jgi:hypothetical protein
MSRQISRGKCVFCQNDYARTGMSRHLEACKARQAALAATDAPPTRLFHLAVQGTYNPIYWMNLEVPASATLYDLDHFLRDVWVECCGHLSMFKIVTRRYMSSVEWDWDDDPDMGVELGQVLAPGLKFSYEYDFGTTTYLDLRVVAEREGAAMEGQSVQIMARNDPPDYRCEECGEPATLICVHCDYPLLCNKCGETHACGEDGFLPVVNSPRMGMCGYTGDAW